MYIGSFLFVVKLIRPLWAELKPWTRDASIFQTLIESMVGIKFLELGMAKNFIIIINFLSNHLLFV